MYTAIMMYHFKPERLVEAFALWRDGVANRITLQPGFIAVQFFHEPGGKAIAIGQWESQSHAEAFMRTGVFADLLKSFDGMMMESPHGGAYTLAYSEQRKENASK